MSFSYQNSGDYQCGACGYMDDDYSYFIIVNGDDLLCTGCYENYRDNCDTVIKDGDDIVFE